MARRKEECKEREEKKPAFDPPAIKKEGKLTRVIQNSGKVDLSMGRRN